MNTSKRKFLSLAVITFAVFALPLLATAQSFEKGGAKEIIGSWDGTIDFFGQPFRALYSFMPGGVMLEADNPALDPNFGNLAFSPGHGAWKRVARRTVRATYQKLAYDDTGALNLVARSTLNVVIGPDGNLTGTLTLRLLTPDGTLVDEFSDLGFSAVPITVDE